MYTIKQIFPWLYSIHEPANVFSCLVTGKNSAILYDTGFGLDNLKKTVEEITDKPVTVILGHGHGDHVNGAFYFEEAYVHPADHELCMKHSSRTYRRGDFKDVPDGFDPESYINGGSFTHADKIKHLEQNRYDLGGINAEIIPMEGHTAGSVGLMLHTDEKTVLLTGDAANTHCWMFLDESLPMSDYINMLKRTRELNFDVFLFGHSNEVRPKSEFDKYIKTAESIDPEKSKPYPQIPKLGGMIYESDGCAIVYNPKKL